MRLCVRTENVLTLPGRLDAIVTLDTDTKISHILVKVLCSILYKCIQPLQSLLYHVTHVIIRFSCFSWSDLFLNFSLGFWHSTYISDLFVKGVIWERLSVVFGAH